MYFWICLRRASWSTFAFFLRSSDVSGFLLSPATSLLAAEPEAEDEAGAEAREADDVGRSQARRVTPTCASALDTELTSVWIGRASW